MSRSAVRAAVLLLLITGLASRLPAQTDPEFVVSLSPSIVTITQGSTASLTVHIAINERPSFEFSLIRPSFRRAGADSHRTRRFHHHCSYRAAHGGHGLF